MHCRSIHSPAVTQRCGAWVPRTVIAWAGCMQVQQNWKSVSWLIQLPSIRDNPRVVSTLFLINHFPLSSSHHHCDLSIVGSLPECLSHSDCTGYDLKEIALHYSPSIIYILIIAPNSCPPLEKWYRASFGKVSCPPSKDTASQRHSQRT